VGFTVAKVVLKHLTKRFEKLIAVNDINLEVKDGEFVCLLGPSGCGKTTTLRCIAGLELQDNGDIYIGDRVVNDLPSADRDIAMVFQFYAIYPGMTVYDNLAFPLKQRKIAKNEIKNKVTETAKMLRIENILDKDAISRTAGEKQRIALGRAFVRDPQVFLLDEPLTNLDADLRAMMRVELKRLHEEIKQTFIYVTHDQLEGMTMADRIAVMESGILQQYDSPFTLFNKPKNLFVAGFIGTPSMNFLECSYDDKIAKIIFDSLSLDVSKYKETIQKEKQSDDLILGVRPTDFLIKKKKDRNRSIEAKVDIIELTGDEKIVDLEVGKNIVKAVVPRRFPIKLNEKVWINLDLNRSHIFDKKTEKAIL
jgi:multiple sugar transport system ATP-binding protein